MKKKIIITLSILTLWVLVLFISKRNGWQTGSSPKAVTETNRAADKSAQENNHISI